MSANTSALLSYICCCFGSSEMLKLDEIIVIIKIISFNNLLWKKRFSRLQGQIQSARLETSPRSSQQSSENYCPGKSGNSALESSFSNFSTLGMSFPKLPQNALKENCLPMLSLQGQKSVFPKADLWFHKILINDQQKRIHYSFIFIWQD